MFERLDLAYSSLIKEKQRLLLRGICSNFVVKGKNISIEPRKWVSIVLDRENFLHGRPNFVFLEPGLRDRQESAAHDDLKNSNCAFQSPEPLSEEVIDGIVSYLRGIQDLVERLLREGYRIE